MDISAITATLRLEENKILLIDVINMKCPPVIELGLRLGNKDYKLIDKVYLILLLRCNSNFCSGPAYKSTKTKK